MKQVEYVKTAEIPLVVMWDFIKDFDNWAHMLNGYQGHQTLNDRELIWEVKGTIGKPNFMPPLPNGCSVRRRLSRLKA